MSGKVGECFCFLAAWWAGEWIVGVGHGGCLFLFQATCPRADRSEELDDVPSALVAVALVVFGEAVVSSAAVSVRGAGRRSHRSAMLGSTILQIISSVPLCGVVQAASLDVVT